MRLLAALALIALPAAPALAQPADPIGDLLARPPVAQPSAPQSAPQAPATAPPPAAPPPASPSAIALPAAPLPYAVQRPQLTAPVFLEETGKTPDAPPTIRDLAYESRLRASFASAQSFQGPMDGGWTLSTAEGTPLYAFEFADRGRGVVEGAWRDVRRPGAPDASGFVDEARRDGGQLVLRFGKANATLTGGYGGVWSGELADGEQRQRVSLRKNPF